MLARPFRLVKEKDFALVMRKGRSYRQPEGQLKTLPNGLENSRFGIIISNKVAKKANVRNLLKRRVRALIANMLPSTKPGMDVVLICNAAILKLDFSQLELFMTRAFRQMYLIK